MANKITVTAPGKINLTLDILGQRANGYHDLRMIMQTIDLYDELTIEKTGFPDIVLTMNKELPDKIPAEKNLVYKAARLMQERFSLPFGFTIHLNKQIPAAAGLAGGSSDCAATMLAINELCDLEFTKEELCELGVELGADVPFCIQKGTMLSEGIGEILTPLSPLPPLWTLLIKPDVSVSTAHVYQAFDEQHISYHPNTQKVLDAIDRKDVITIGENLSNVLESVTFPEHPVLTEIKEFLMQNGSIGALMSGSGPTTYGLFQDEILANLAFRSAKSHYKEYDVVLCKTTTPPFCIAKD